MGVKPTGGYSPQVDSLATPSRKRKRSSSPMNHLSQKRSSTSPIPTSVLLLATPSLLAVPPNHKSQITSYIISLNALRKCLASQTLAPDFGCRAWTALAELALKIVKAGWTQLNTYPWARSLEIDVENAIGKGLLISQQSPSLAVYKQYLTLLQSRLAQWQQKDNYSRTLLKRLSSSITPSVPPKKFDQLRAPPWLIYTTHLTSITHYLSSSPPDYKSAISSVQDLLLISEYLSDSPIRLLTHVLRLRVLVDARMWDSVGEALLLAEFALGFSHEDPNKTPNGKAKAKDSKRTSEEFVSFDDPFEASMAIHTLMMSVIYYTHIGQASAISPRLSHLHALLDSDALKLFPNGTVNIKLSFGPPLVLKVTHPRILFLLAYLVSSTSKRDPVGRKPKRKIFAVEGLKRCQETSSSELTFNRWADPLDAEDVDERMAKIRADLLSEVVAVCITRNEFDEAKQNLDELIAHTRNYDLFDSYAARITLHHGHLAHALGDGPRAQACYTVVANLAAPGTYVHASARAGHLALRIASGEAKARQRDPDWEEEVEEVLDMCQGLGGTMEAVRHVLKASMANEFLTSKEHLRPALDLATTAQDNYIRALVLALISAHYLVTSEAHARTMLETARQLSAGLGATRRQDQQQGQQSPGPGPSQQQSSPASLGNLPLGLWIGERFLEIYRREGDEKLVQKQEAINAQFSAALKLVTQNREKILGKLP